MSAKQMAVRLDVSHKTVLAHRLHAMEKLGLRSDAALTRYALGGVVFFLQNLRWCNLSRGN